MCKQAFAGQNTQQIGDDAAWMARFCLGWVYQIGSFPADFSEILFTFVDFCFEFPLRLICILVVFVVSKLSSHIAFIRLLTESANFNPLFIRSEQLNTGRSNSKH